MKFRARFNGASGERSRAVQLDGEAPHVEVRLDDEPAVYDVVSRGPGSWSLVGPGGRHVQATVHRDGDGLVSVAIGSARFSFELMDDLTARAMSTAGRSGARKGGDLKSAIPGRVVRILVAPGDEVTPGQSLLVLEAMKMENEVRSPRAGRIRSIEVTAGQAVGGGDLLVRFED